MTNIFTTALNYGAKMSNIPPEIIRRNYKTPEWKDLKKNNPNLSAEELVLLSQGISHTASKYEELMQELVKTMSIPLYL